MSFGILKCSILFICVCVMMGVNKFYQRIDYYSPTALLKEKSDKSRSFVNDSNSNETNEWTTKNLRNRAEKGDDMNLNRKNSNNGSKNKDMIGEKSAKKKVEERNRKKKKIEGEEYITVAAKNANAKKKVADSDYGEADKKDVTVEHGIGTLKERGNKPEDGQQMANKKGSIESTSVPKDRPKQKKDIKKADGSISKNDEQEGSKSSKESDKFGAAVGPTQSRTKKKSTERTSKPKFILHIGPPKTGTTTLQCELGAKYQKLRDENFFYLGTYYSPLCGLPTNHTIEGFVDVTRPVLLHCYAAHTSEGCDMDKKWKKFEDILVSHKDHNVIMSDEMFHHHFLEEDVKRMAKILNAHWDVRILYTYRHFHSSLPSMYHQLNDPYATQVGMAYAHEKTIWPDDGGYKIGSFRNSNHFFIDDEMKRFSYWTESFDTVKVFNMHNTDGADYLPTFLCTMIPEAKSLCQPGSKKKSEDSSHNDNGSSSKHLHYDMLVVEAHEQGLLKNSTKTRVQVRDAVQEYCISKQWTSIKSFPLDCLSEAEMESFLHESLQQASILKRYFANSRDSSAASIDSEIRSGFKEYRDEKKFCSVNTARTLEEYPWRQFFLHLD